MIWNIDINASIFVLFEIIMFNIIIIKLLELFLHSIRNNHQQSSKKCLPCSGTRTCGKVVNLLRVGTQQKSWREIAEVTISSIIVKMTRPPSFFPGPKICKNIELLLLPLIYPSRSLSYFSLKVVATTKREKCKLVCTNEYDKFPEHTL